MSCFSLREACHYVIERPVMEDGGDGGEGEGAEGERKEVLRIPCTQWDFDTTTYTSTLTSEVSDTDTLFNQGNKLLLDSLDLA